MFGKKERLTPEQKQAAAEDKRLEKIKLGKLKRNNRCALCLGGGGARGFAHIGAIKAFEEAGFDFDIVVGTSVGSIIGALYAYGVSSAAMLQIGESLKEKEIHNGNLLFPNDAGRIGKIITDLIGDVTIEQINARRNKTFCAVAVDLVSASEVVLSSGSAAFACSASSCVPVFFKPMVTEDGKHLVDGGVLNNIPADVCRMLGAQSVITVDVNPTRGEGSDKLGSIGVLKTVFGMMSANSSQSGIINSDVIIAADTSEFSSGSKDGFMEMYERGYSAAKQKLYEISQYLYK